MGFFNRRIRTLAWTAALCLPLVCFPAQVRAQGTEGAGAQSGKTVLTTEVRGYTDDVSEGKGEVELPDKMVITAEGDSLADGLLLVVESVEAGDADYDRVEASMEGKGTKLRIFDIYFVDGNGQRYAASETVTVTISLNGVYKSPAVFSVPPAGASKLESSVKNDSISFDLVPGGAQDAYYVLAETKTTSGGSDQGGGSGGGTGGSDQGSGTGGSGSGSDGSGSGSGGSGSGSDGSGGGAGGSGSGSGDSGSGGAAGAGNAGNVGAAGNAAGAAGIAGTAGNVAGTAEIAGTAGNAAGTAGIAGAAGNATGTAGIGTGAGSAGSNTGDDTNPTLWLLACIGAAAALILIAVKRQKRGK